MKVKSLLSVGVCTLALSACGLGPQAKVMLPSSPKPAPGANEILVELEPTELKREGRELIRLDSNGKPSVEYPGLEKLVHGDLKVGDEHASFYLPLYGPHPTTTKNNHSFENTSTLISVDSDNNGQLARNEDWWASLPVRLGDKMFEVATIDPGSKWILLKSSSVPLSGAIVGKRCPGFQYITQDGTIAALADYKGKFVLLDVWSMT